MVRYRYAHLWIQRCRGWASDHSKNKSEVSTSFYSPSIVSDVMKGLYDMYRLVYDPMEPSLYSERFLILVIQKPTPPERLSSRSFSRSVSPCAKPSSSRNVFVPAKCNPTSPTPRRSPQFPASRLRSSRCSRNPASPLSAQTSPNSYNSTFSASTGASCTSST